MGPSAYEGKEMTEFEQCILLTLKDIKSELQSVSDNCYAIAKELKIANEREHEECHWDYDIHKDLEKISDSLARIYTVQAERL